MIFGPTKRGSEPGPRRGLSCETESGNFLWSKAASRSLHLSFDEPTTMSMFGHSGELKIPPQAKANRDAREILRIWSSGEHQEFILKHDIWDDPAAWGLLLVDVARHVARAFEERGHDKEEVYQRILQGFQMELETPTDDPTGQIEP
jgi:Domain of unknown function (DUF5076)